MNINSTIPTAFYIPMTIAVSIDCDNDKSLFCPARFVITNRRIFMSHSIHVTSSIYAVFDRNLNKLKSIILHLFSILNRWLLYNRAHH